MRWPHWVGFRTTTGADGGVRLVGRNRFIHVAIAIVGLTAAAPMGLLFDANTVSADRLGGLVLALALLEAVALGGLWYLVARCPVERRIFFLTNGTVAIDDAFVLGRVSHRTIATGQMSAVFSVRWPSGSAFRLTQIALTPPSGATIALVPTNSPLYSWQAKRAYAALQAYALRPGIGLRLGPPPDFDKV